MRRYIVTFDGLDTNPGDSIGTILPAGHMGFNWTNMSALNAVELDGTGYQKAIHSGDSVGYNTAAGDVSFATTDETFSFRSGYFASASGSQTVTFHAFRNGIEVASKTVTINDTAQTFVEFGKGFTHIDSITVTLTGQLAMDDLATHFDAPDDVAGTTETGTATRDVLRGTVGNDTVDISQGANDRVGGGNGNDGFTLGAQFRADDRIMGSNGVDKVTLSGDYTGANAVVFGEFTMQKVEDLAVTTGHSYDLTIHDGTVTDGRVLRVDASALAVGETLTFNGAAEAGGQLKVTGGNGDDFITGGKFNDVIRGGIGHDTIDLSAGGGDRAFGGDGENTFVMGSALSADDRLIGGGVDSVLLEGATTVVLGANTLSGIDFLRLQGAFDYNLTMNDGNVVDVLQVDAESMTDALHALVFDGSQETTGRFSVVGSAGNDTMKGGGGNDTFRGGAGGDTFTGGAGMDFYDYNGAGDSTGAHFDTITDFTDDEFIDLPVTLDTNTFNADVNAGALATATFDADMAAAIGGTQLRANSAVLFRPDSGDYVGKTFLVVDGNGTAGYQAGEDFVVAITFTGTLDGDNFI